MTSERGKRRMAGRIAGAWGLFSAAALVIVGYGHLDQAQINGIVSLHSAVTMVSGPVIVGLFGLDVAQLKLPEKS